MASPKTETQAGSTATAEAGEFASLLSKEFKPKTDQARDAVVQAVLMLSAFVFVLINLCVDLLYAFLYPRVRYD